MDQPRAGAERREDDEDGRVDLVGRTAFVGVLLASGWIVGLTAVATLVCHRVATSCV